MQATGDFAADDPGGGGSRDGEQRRAAEDEVPPRRRDPWMEAPDYGPSDDRFSIEVKHGGFFCGMGRNRTYLDTRVDLFDELSRWSFSCYHLDYILKDLGYNTSDTSLRVYWCKPGCTVGDGLVAIKWDKDTDKMKTCSIEEKKLTVYVDHVNLLEKQGWDDVVLEPVPLPAVISPSKPVKKRRMDDDEEAKNAAKGKLPMSVEEELEDEANSAADSSDDEKASVLSSYSGNSSDLDSDFADSDYDFDEDDDQFKKHVDEDVTDALVAKASQKCVSQPELDIGEEELELPEEMNGGLTYKWKPFNKLTYMHNPTFKLGMVFSDVKELRAAIAMYCVRNRRQLKKKRNNKIRVEVGCRPNCNWKLIATKQTRKDGSFVVTKLIDKHDCERVWEVKELTAPMIAEEYLDDIRDNENLSLKSFAKKVQKQCNMRPNRFKLARAKLACLKKIRGDEIAQMILAARELPVMSMLEDMFGQLMSRPLRDQSEWAKTNGPDVQPPLYEKKVGRPKKNRRKNLEEIEGGTRLSRAGVTVHCGYCKDPGHNRTDCPRLIAIREAEAVEQARREAEENVPENVST
ncbi:hypothetical protein ACQ4PT_070442 [Festuca glaucescens]